VCCDILSTLKGKEAHRIQHGANPYSGAVMVLSWKFWFDKENQGEMLI
jgi:hypothetical protein